MTNSAVSDAKEYEFPHSGIESMRLELADEVIVGVGKRRPHLPKQITCRCVPRLTD
jgi:hypothetical protein